MNIMFSWYQAIGNFKRAMRNPIRNCHLPKSPITLVVRSGVSVLALETRDSFLAIRSAKSSGIPFDSKSEK